MNIDPAMLPNAEAGPSSSKPTTTTTSGPEKSKKQSKKQLSTKQKLRNNKLKEKAVELGTKLETKVKLREGRKARRDRAKKAWE